MSHSADRAKSVWLLTFGDVTTLLITFFILMIVLNKGEITRIQKYTDLQLDQSFSQLRQNTSHVNYLYITRSSLGIQIDINEDQAFEKGGFIPSQGLVKDLRMLGASLKDLSIFKFEIDKLPKKIQKHLLEEKLNWRLEVSIAGHTDNDPINPLSALRNNWFLSTMRAEQVMQVLYAASDLDKSLFSVAGYGEYRPLVANDTPEHKAKNRRVEILITATFEK